jgi:ribosomal protein L7Ae-like RNA K-turn-binding protein
MAIDAISMANKAGQVVIGFERVKAALNKGSVAILVHASDAGAGGLQKLDDLAAANGEKTAIIRLFTGEQLDLALGRPNVVHAALFGHPASRVFLAHSLRYERWREEKPAGKGIHIGRDKKRPPKKVTE